MWILKGFVIIRVNGKIWSKRKNLVVVNGIYDILDLMVGQGSLPTYIAVGTGTTPPADTDTALENEVYRTSLTDSYRSGSQAIFSAFIDAGSANGYTLSEVGLFAGDGRLIARALIDPVISKNSSITVTVDWVISLA